MTEDPGQETADKNLGDHHSAFQQTRIGCLLGVYYVIDVMFDVKVQQST